MVFGEREGGGEVTEEEVQKLGKLTERYCVVLQTLVKKPVVKVRLVGKGGEEEEGVRKEIVHGSTL